MIFALDLEGVLAPEIWPILGAHFELPELSLTTRDLGDFSELMHRRVDATRSRRLTLKELQAVAHQVEPYLGARDFLSRLRALGQVVIISDTFHEFSEPLVQKLGGHSLFANPLELDRAGAAPPRPGPAPGPPPPRAVARCGGAPPAGGGGGGPRPRAAPPSRWRRRPHAPLPPSRTRCRARCRPPRCSARAGFRNAA